MSFYPPCRDLYFVLGCIPTFSVRPGLFTVQILDDNEDEDKDEDEGNNHSSGKGGSASGTSPDASEEKATKKRRK